MCAWFYVAILLLKNLSLLIDRRTRRQHWQVFFRTCYFIDWFSSTFLFYLFTIIINYLIILAEIIIIANSNEIHRPFLPYFSRHTYTTILKSRRFHHIWSTYIHTRIHTLLSSLLHVLVRKRRLRKWICFTINNVFHLHFREIAQYIMASFFKLPTVIKVLKFFWCKLQNNVHRD